MDFICKSLIIHRYFEDMLLSFTDNFAQGGWGESMKHVDPTSSVIQINCKKNNTTPHTFNASMDTG